MTTTDVSQYLATPGRNGGNGRTGQGTAIEQSRAIAEVQAMIIVAQQCPRNVAQAISDMRESCRRKELADRAFFRYPQGGQMISGPSIQLARELARVWGNFQYGLTELRRDDEYGQSEMLAFAWDVQTNTRNSSIVINPHRQYTGGKDLTDLRAIYENNANVGARRVREAILAVLPAWFVEEAKDLCAKTIADGGGVPLAQRIANAIEVFGNLGITVPQLEVKIGSPSAKWTDHDVAQLRIIRQSLLRGEATKDEEFPPEHGAGHVTVTEITGGQPAQASDDGNSHTPAAPESPNAGEVLSDDPGSATKEQVGKLQSIYQSRFGFTRAQRDQMLTASEQIIGRDLTGPKNGRGRSHDNLSSAEARKLIDTLESIPDTGALTAYLAERSLESAAEPVQDDPQVEDPPADLWPEAVKPGEGGVR